MNELMSKPEKYHVSVISVSRILIKEILSLLTLWIQKYRTRKQLRELPESLYDDLGVDRSMVKKESERPFWD
ncbi:DUF1127 domain-containing protein [Vibrio quintilis]|uniref:YjiS-like domain-containing protein n=1 Tax=Vibrio quintilis TaxID=1117707 RepID=A0A1M7Z187_9VIBR|nr:DUF1127 domain-containing protein [Vibrio quintilis]SHO58446.1 hypothetical protein VQ7734_04218 [Vibrio quintilis]